MNELVKQIDGLEKSSANNILKQFEGYFKQAEEWKTKAMSLVVKSADQKEEMQQAREARIALKNIRVETEKTRKALKEDSLRTGKAIDGMANVIKFLIQPIESHLQEQEDFIKIIEENKARELKEHRQELLLEYLDDTSFYDLSNMPDSVFNTLLENSKSAFNKKIDEQKRIESERIEREKKEREEQERIRKENEELKKKAEAERKKNEEILAKEREKAEKARKKNEEILAKEREKAEKARKILEEKEKAERLAREKVEKELREKREAEAREAKIIEDEARKKEEEALRAERAPDKKKLVDFANSILSIDSPSLKSEVAVKIANEAIRQLASLSEAIVSQSEKL